MCCGISFTHKRMKSCHSSKMGGTMYSFYTLSCITMVFRPCLCLTSWEIFVCNCFFFYYFMWPSLGFSSKEQNHKCIMWKVFAHLLCAFERNSHLNVPQSYEIKLSKLGDLFSWSLCKYEFIFLSKRQFKI